MRDLHARRNCKRTHRNVRRWEHSSIFLSFTIDFYPADVHDDASLHAIFIVSDSTSSSTR